jgi:hypothetical protein
MKNYYEPYKNALLNIYNCRSSTTIMKSRYWNNRITDTKKINTLLKKDNLMNPVTMVKHIYDIYSFQTITCENCNTEGYCVCSLDSTYLHL